MRSFVPKDFSSTKQVKVSERIIDQVIGQEKSVELIKKAAAQKRNVLLVGEPGTGKSLLAQGMAEILPLSALSDVLVYPNQEDPNNPKIRVVKAGQGKKILQEERLESRKEEDNIRLIGFVLPLGWFLLSSAIWQMKWISDIIYAALLLLGGFLMMGFALGTQMRSREGTKTPKLLIDNAGKKIAPFFEATGARAGSLLGDVRHDPLQCNYGFNELYLQKESKNGVYFEKKSFVELWSEMFEKYGKEIIRNEKNYEAIMFPQEEKIFTLGYKDGKVALSRILSLNRQPFSGELVELKFGERTIALTPEHKIDTSSSEKEAGKVTEKDNLFLLVKKEIERVLA